MSPLFSQVVDAAERELHSERLELAAKIAADLDRLDLCDRLLAPGSQPFGLSGRNHNLAAYLARRTDRSGSAAFPGFRRLASRLLTAGG